MPYQTINDLDLSGYERRLPSPPPLPAPVMGEEALMPRRSAFLRCPLPAVPGVNVNPDNLRAFYAGGTTPQTRAFNPAISSNGGTGGGVTNINASVTSSITTTTNTNSQPPIFLGSMTTGPLDPGQQFIGAMITGSEAWAIFNVQASTACRIRFYATDQAQIGDSQRDVNTPAAPGTGQQDLIADVLFDTAPFSWDLGVLGTNNMPGVDQRLFCTVDNTGLASQSAITVSIQYSALGISTTL